MEFQRVGEHTIKCVISEDEIYNLGFTLEEIMSNGERTQEFMNHIFDLAEQEFQTKFDMGIKTVRADFLPNHTLSLTFSEHPGAEGMVEHLKDIVNGLLSSIPKEKMEELAKAKREEKALKEPEKEWDMEVPVIALFTFQDMDTLCSFSRKVDLVEIPENTLYKYKGKYIIVINLTDQTEEDVLRLSMLTDEYASDIQVGPERRAFLEEHAKCILKNQAIEQLRQI